MGTNPDTLAHVLALLAEVIAEGQPLHVEIEHGDLHAVLQVKPIDKAPPPELAAEE